MQISRELDVPERVREFFKNYGTGTQRRPFQAAVPWTAGTEGGFVTQTFVCSSPMEAMAYLSLYHTRYDLQTLGICCIGSSVPKSVHLPKSKTTLLFDNDLVGRLWDIRIACLIRDKPVHIVYENQHCAFKLINRSFQLPVDQVSLSAFEKAAGIRTGIKTAKAKGHITFLQQLIHDSS